MKRIIFIKIAQLLGMILTLSFVSSCDRQKLDDFVGPAVCPSANFYFVSPFQVSAPSVDFGAGQIANITATFNEEVSWEVKITGQTSGAFKSYKGRSFDISIPWKGKANEGFPFFKTETCDVVLKISCTDPIQTTVNIVPNTFVNVGKLLSDFDGHGAATFANPPYGVYKVTAQSGVKNTPIALSPQGGNYYRILGDAGDSLTWFFGGTWCNLNLTTLTVNDPSKVYFNVFANSNGKKNSLLSFTFTEAGSPKTFNKTIDWDGWKMLTFTLADAGITTPASVTQLDIGLGASPQKGKTGEINFDFAIITENGTFYE